MRSYVPDFEMSAAANLSDALAFLARGYQPFAGGTDIMVLFNAGKLPAAPLVNIRRLPELRNITVTSELMEIGAAVTYSEIRQHSLVQEEFPLLSQSASWTGSIANQNRGTLGGNIANASPAADSSPVLLVYDAQLKLLSSHGHRCIPYSAFHLGYKKLALLPGELISSIQLPRTQKPTLQYGRKVGTRKAQAISKVTLAALAMQNNVQYRIAAGSVAPVPLRCLKTEAFLANQPLTPAMIEEAKAIIRQDISPISDIRSTEDYRLAVTQNLLVEFLEALL